MGFTNAENSYSEVVFYARRLHFAEGGMDAMNAINLPETSSFRDPFHIPLLIDPFVQALTVKVAEEEEDEEGEDSHNMAKLAKQINSHMVVIDVDNPATHTAPQSQNAPEVNPAFLTTTSSEVTSVSLIALWSCYENAKLSLVLLL